MSSRVAMGRDDFAVFSHRATGRRRRGLVHRDGARLAGS